MNLVHYQPLTTLFPHETVTHAHLKEVALPGNRTFALITLDNLLEHKPATFGPNSLLELGTLLQKLKKRTAAGEISAVGITGVAKHLVAGADLSAMRRLTDPQMIRLMGRLGHEVFDTWNTLPVPTFAFINGAAIGGGLELALAAQYRTVTAAAEGISLPESRLGLVPGWGGVYRLPRLIGPMNAVKVMIENPLSGNKSLTGQAAFDIGIADSVFKEDDFLTASLEWASKVLGADVETLQCIEARRIDKARYDTADWQAAVAHGRAVVSAKTSDAAPGPGRVLDLMESGAYHTHSESADAQVEALCELMQSPEFKDTMYAFIDLRRRAKKASAVAGNAESDGKRVAQHPRKVGVVGAGLMASQLALLFVRKLQIPVVMTDLSQERVDNGVGYVHAKLDALADTKAITKETSKRLKDFITGSTDLAALQDADFVIEAVFEEMSAKKNVFSQVEAVVSQECLLATNTSSLSVTEMAAGMQHPERLIGFHFFNPVAVMPLIEVVHTDRSSPQALSAAFAVGRMLEKTTVLVQDSAAFVVNRLLLRLIGEVVNAFDGGTPAEVVDNALKPMGLPMRPLVLLGMVGIPVAQHVTKSLQEAFGPRFPVSDNLQTLVDNGIHSLWATGEQGAYLPQATLELLKFGNRSKRPEEVLERVQNALALEIHLMLEEGVVATPEDVDLCMVLGAGWPLHLGGITPYLDRVGASQRVNGQLFHAIPDPLLQ